MRLLMFATLRLPAFLLGNSLEYGRQLHTKRALGKLVAQQLQKLRSRQDSTHQQCILGSC